MTECGFGKRCDFDEFNTKNRGGIGVSCHRISEKTGPLCGIAAVSDDEDIMLITGDGTVIRTPAAGIPLYSRTAGGVIIMRLARGREDLQLLADRGEEGRRGRTGGRRRNGRRGRARDRRRRGCVCGRLQRAGRRNDLILRRMRNGRKAPRAAPGAEKKKAKKAAVLMLLPALLLTLAGCGKAPEKAPSSEPAGNVTGEPLRAIFPLEEIKMSFPGRQRGGDLPV